MSSESARSVVGQEHELDHCRSTRGPLVAAYVDVVALESLGESEECGAGDELLKRVVAVISEQLRSFDLIVRLGDDAFLGAMSNMTLLDARQRFSQVASVLAGAPCAGAIRTGFAELTPDDSAAQLSQRGQRPDRQLPRRP